MTQDTNLMEIGLIADMVDNEGNNNGAGGDNNNN